VLETWPNAVREAYKNGTFPLHESVQRILEAYLPCIRAVDPTGRVAAHCIKSTTSVDAVRFLRLVAAPIRSRHWGRSSGGLRGNSARSFGMRPAPGPAVARVGPDPKHRDGLTALLIALASALPLLEVVRVLIDQEPPANRSALELVGPFPLHVAASHVDTPLAMEPVVERWPESVGQRDGDGDGSLPIHLAVARREVPLEGVQYLVERDPRSVRQCDRRGFLPLHLAVSHAEPSIELVRILVDHHPPSVGHADNDGSLPLHLAVSHAEPSSELVRILVDHHPPSVGHADNDGSLPLHLAASHAKPPAATELVRFLVDQIDTTASR
jgi:Ankyrin repeats (3 copies)